MAIGEHDNSLSDDRGTVGAIVLFPVFAICALVLVQGVFWQQDRTVASSAANKASAAVALYDASSGDAQTLAEDRVRAAGMRDVTVSISRDANFTTVTITARSHGLLPFTASTITATSVTPTDRFVAP